jgi:hypothetical protein
MIINVPRVGVYIRNITDLKTVQKFSIILQLTWYRRATPIYRPGKRPQLMAIRANKTTTTPKPAITANNAKFEINSQVMTSV